jgi:hypothetical protein
MESSGVTGSAGGVKASRESDVDIDYVDYGQIVERVRVQYVEHGELVQHFKVIKELVGIYMRYTPREKGRIDLKYSTHLWNHRFERVKQVKNKEPAYVDGKAFFTSLHSMRIISLINYQRAFIRNHEKLRKITLRDAYVTGGLIKPCNTPIIKWKAKHIRDTIGATANIKLIRTFLNDCMYVCNSTDLFDQVHGLAFKDDLAAAKELFERGSMSFHHQYIQVTKLFRKALFPHI